MSQLKHVMQFFTEMEMNSPCHTIRHFNYVQEERASKEAVAFILKIKKKIQNSWLKGKGTHSIRRAEMWFSVHVLGKEPEWADETTGKKAPENVLNPWTGRHPIGATDLPMSGSTA